MVQMVEQPSGRRMTAFGDEWWPVGGGDGKATLDRFGKREKREEEERSHVGSS
jgi:hypothetical protein